MASGNPDDHRNVDQGRRRGVRRAPEVKYPLSEASEKPSRSEPKLEGISRCRIFHRIPDFQCKISPRDQWLTLRASPVRVFFTHTAQRIRPSAVSRGHLTSSNRTRAAEVRTEPRSGPKRSARGSSEVVVPPSPGRRSPIRVLPGAQPANEKPRDSQTRATAGCAPGRSLIASGDRRRGHHDRTPPTPTREPTPGNAVTRCLLSRPAGGAVDLDLPNHQPTQAADATSPETRRTRRGRPKGGRQAPDARRAARNEDPTRSAAQCRET
jgi:hypothetical protein